MYKQCEHTKGLWMSFFMQNSRCIIWIDLCIRRFLDLTVRYISVISLFTWVLWHLDLLWCWMCVPDSWAGETERCGEAWFASVFWVKKGNQKRQSEPSEPWWQLLHRWASKKERPEHLLTWPLRHRWVLRLATETVVFYSVLSPHPVEQTLQHDAIIVLKSSGPMKDLDGGHRVFEPVKLMLKASTYCIWSQTVKAQPTWLFTVRFYTHL